MLFVPKQTAHDGIVFFGAISIHSQLQQQHKRSALCYFVRSCFIFYFYFFLISEHFIHSVYGSPSRCFRIDAVSSTGNWLTEQRAINKSKISHFIVLFCLFSSLSLYLFSFMCLHLCGRHLAFCFPLF